MNYIKVIGTPLYQWETGRKIQITPLHKMHVNAVHFSNFGDAEALVVNPREENGNIIADIPNILLQSGRNIVVYTVNVAQDLVETLVECTIAVRNRAKPADYVYTETEVLSIQSVVDEAFRKAMESGELIGDNLQLGKNVIIVGGEKETDTGRVEVDRDFETYAASNRKFAAYDYNGFLAKDKLVNGKPLFVDTLVWQELQLDAYSRQNVASDLIEKDYQANPEKYYDDGDCIRRDIHIHYPMKDGQVAIIEKGGVLRVYNLESENVNTGATKTAWLIFANDDAQNGSPNRMYNEFWQLSKLGSIEAPKADAAFKNVRTQAVYAPWMIFDNDGGTADTYNRLYNDWWKLNKVKTIDAPMADANFKSVKINGKDIVQEVLSSLPIYEGGVE